MEEFVEYIGKSLPCREHQLEEIFKLIGEEDEPLPPSIYVYGSTSTGKSACITSAVKYLGYKHVQVNAVECYSSKMLYETILNNLTEHRCNRDNKYAPAYKCDTMKDFTNYMNAILPKHGYRPVIITIDKAERLRDMDSNILPTFLRLKEFCKLNICTIFISQIVFEKYYLKTGLREPFKIFFPQYNNNELYKIISLSRQSCTNYVLSQRSCNPDIREEIQSEFLFSNYLNAYLMVFSRPCRDLVELRHMARMNFLKYCEPIFDGCTKGEDVTKLWRHIAPVLKTSLETLYLRIQPSKNFKTNNEDPLSKELEQRMERLGITKQDMAVLKNDHLTEELTSTKVWAQSFELPFYAKFLLIASYLASYNPVKEDKRLFMKNHGKQKKRLQQVNAKAKISDKLNEQLGPKYFTLDRLLAIFYSIVEERASLTANLMCQVPALVALRLLSTSADHSRYRCTAPAQLVTTVAHSLGFNLRKYLYDYI